MKRACILGFVAALLVSCGPKFIEGTTVPDTPDNQELVSVIENYRQAVENKDASALAQMVSRSYFENASSTAVTKDDYGYEELLKKVLPVLRDNVKKVTYRVAVSKIAVVGDEASVFVEWELTFQYTEGGQEGWSTAKDRNKLDLVVEDGFWKIAAGL